MTSQVEFRTIKIASLYSSRLNIPELEIVDKDKYLVVNVNNQLILYDHLPLSAPVRVTETGDIHCIVVDSEVQVPIRKEFQLMWVKDGEMFVVNCAHTNCKSLIYFRCAQNANAPLGGFPSTDDSQHNMKFFIPHSMKLKVCETQRNEILRMIQQIPNETQIFFGTDRLFFTIHQDLIKELVENPSDYVLPFLMRSASYDKLEEVDVLTTSFSDDIAAMVYENFLENEAMTDAVMYEAFDLLR